MDMRIEDLLKDQTALFGARVKLQGRLIVLGPKTSFLASSYEKYKAGEKILLQDEGKIARDLLRQLPPYGGGDCIYDENAEVTGVVQGETGGICLAEISDCKVSRNETTIHVDF